MLLWQAIFCKLAKADMPSALLLCSGAGLNSGWGRSVMCEKANFLLGHFSSSTGAGLSYVLWSVLVNFHPQNSPGAWHSLMVCRLVSASWPSFGKMVTCDSQVPDSQSCTAFWQLINLQDQCLRQPLSQPHQFLAEWIRSREGKSRAGDPWQPAQPARCWGGQQGECWPSHPYTPGSCPPALHCVGCSLV